MRIAIASTYIPFVRGGGTKIVDDLQQELARRGHDVERLLLPFTNQWREIPEQTLGLRMLEVDAPSQRVDLLIAIRYPAYALRHHNKVAWFIHHHREAYDLWGTPWCGMPDTDEGRHYRDMMRRSDDLYLRECRQIYTNSRVVAERLKKFNQLTAADVLYPPLPTDHPFRPGPFGDYIVYPSRLTGIKRQHLAIEAMQHVRYPLRLVIIGKPDAASYEKQLRRQIARLGLEDRVQMIGWASEAEKARWIAESCGCLYLAYDEDSYGYVTLEAFHAHKPVITLTDSGGPNEVIRDGHNGLVVPPQAEALAAAMERLWRDRDLTQRMGQRARQTIDEHRIGWDHVVRGLVA